MASPVGSSVPALAATPARFDADFMVTAVRHANREVGLAVGCGGQAVTSVVGLCIRSAPTPVRVRVLCDHRAVERVRGALSDDLPLLRSTRVLVRVSDRTPHAMFFVDRRLAAINRGVTVSGPAATVTGALPLVSLVVEVFEQLWLSATPLGSVHPSAPLLARQILVRLAAGMTDTAIGYELDVSARTVRRHVNALMERLHARSRFELGVRATELGWLGTGENLSMPEVH